MTSVSRSFFQSDPLTCARALVGCSLIWHGAGGIIVETEAYAEFGDEASHTFLRRGAQVFLNAKPAGTLYVYLNYGVHWLLNFLVRDGTVNGFVLVRALQPTQGVGLMQQRRRQNPLEALCSGPGKLTQALAITAEFHGRDLYDLPEVSLTLPPHPPRIDVDRRIGISRAAEREWRFLLADSPFVSVKKTRPRNV
ncbi:MAG TPA: DNA-3-methyladenine glycosylase [Chthoniobacterales bacterium]